jgi:acyl-coenzyme A thioesterase PaaI-like protein
VGGGVVGARFAAARTAAVTTRFDDGTDLAPAGDLRWRATVQDRWSNGDGPGINGGLFAALATRAVMEATGLPPRSLTIHYLAAPALGEVTIAASVPRKGRSTGFVRLEFGQGDRHVAQAMAVCTAWRPDAPAFADAPAPRVPALEHCMPVDPRHPRVPPVVSNYEMRVSADPDRLPATVGGWIRTREARPSDPVSLAAITDAFMPPAFMRPGERVMVPTLELTIHFRGEPPAGEHPWVKASFVSRTAAGGVVEEDGELWSEDGVLLVQSRQLALMRRVERGS